MSNRLLKIPDVAFRGLVFDQSGINTEKRSIELSFSSEYCVQRSFGGEILDHSPECVDMGRIAGGAGALLWNHDPDRQIGVVERAEIVDGKIRATVRFSRSAFAEEKWQDVQDGILKNVSIGYRIHEAELDREEDGVPMFRVTKWEPTELTMTPVPADPHVGIGRSDNSQNREIVIKVEKKNLANENGNGHTRAMSEPANSPEINVEAERAAGATAFRERAKKINDFAKEVRERRKVNADDIASEYIYGGKAEKSFDDFRADVLMRFDDLKPVETSPDLGLNKKEVESFSLMRAIRNISQKKFDGTFEQRVSEAAAKHYRKNSISETTIVLPEEIANYAVGGGERGFEEAVRTQAALWSNRAQNATTGTAGGFTVPTVLGSMIEFLRNKTVLGQAGITQLSGLQGDLALPVQSGGATAYWVSETGALTDSQATFTQKTLTPHRLGGTIPFTTQFLAQSSLPAEQFIRNELMTVIAIALDAAGLIGTGADGQPTGIAYTSGINQTVTYGGAATWADVVEHETGIAVDNADIGSMAFILSAAAVGKWKTILRDAVAGSKYLIDDGMTANGYSVLRSNQISAANQSFFGVWNQLVLASWAGMEVIVDPYTLKKSGQVEITMNTMHDFLVRQPLAFNVSTDTAAA